MGTSVQPPFHAQVLPSGILVLVSSCPGLSFSRDPQGSHRTSQKATVALLEIVGHLLLWAFGSQHGSDFLAVKMRVKSLSHVRLFATPWTAAYQAPLSMGFSRQEYWSGLPFPSPGHLPNPRD